ncbi:hypothetical protein [Sphingomonas metalli]|uniref:hypothetical protein n=1 Tax=Sphingomonas metalli TaxID=1779358 RepID=UPI001662FAD5|nr:hypothetical protein [Sphingomonas metalli]
MAFDAEAAVAAGKDLSWGKAGIDFDQYRRDAIDCGTGGATADISQREDTRQVLDGTRRQDQAIDQANARSTTMGAQDGRSLDPEEFDRMMRDYSSIYQRSIRGGIKGTQRFMQDRVVTCLRSRGYVPFRLNKAQTHARDKLRVGTMERRRFLYELASDPAVLQAQAVDEELSTGRQSGA